MTGIGSRGAEAAVSVDGVVKRFGDTVALAGVDLHVDEGTVLGLLGPNGAGKTTLVRVLATLLIPNEGRARVLGHDVVAEAGRVRELIGLAGQFAAVDEILTGRENLRMFGRLFHTGRAAAARRADELLERFDLADAADRPAKTYSGGMRRRLDLASSLITRPRVLFLDEPTAGLDPRSRNQIWAIVRELVAGGTTVLLTTQYLEEADQLADRIAVIDHGRLIAQGTGDELKDSVGGQMIQVRLASSDDRERAHRVLAALGCGGPQPGGSNGQLTVPAAHDGVGMLTEAARALSEAGVPVSDLGLRRPTLDDVFLELTGTRPEGDGDAEDERGGGGEGGRPSSDGEPRAGGDGRPQPVMDPAGSDAPERAATRSGR
jgi:daunorubicin resistance ABC transporter ATP-binding subunit